MQAVAAEMNLSETAFVVAPPDRADGADLELRWFTPTVEVALCGHATLASAHVLWESGRLGPTEPARFRHRERACSSRRRAADDRDRARLPRPPEPRRSTRRPASRDGARRAGRRRPRERARPARRARRRRDRPRPRTRTSPRSPGIDARGVVVTARGEPDSRVRLRLALLRPPRRHRRGSRSPAPPTARSRRTGPSAWRRPSSSRTRRPARGGVVRCRVAGDRVHPRRPAVTVWHGTLT